LSACQEICTVVEPTTTYNCTSGNCVAVSGNGGTYSTLAACQAACGKQSVTGVTGYMEPCIGGTIDDHMGASVILDQPVAVDTSFQVLVSYYTPGGSCAFTSTQSFTVDVPSGSISSNFNACSSGYYISSGATICNACIVSCTNPDVVITGYTC
jgi:hypothetical protein